MVQYKQKNLILNTVTDKAVHTGKRQKTAADQKLKAVAKKTINTDKMLQLTNNKILQLIH